MAESERHVKFAERDASASAAAAGSGGGGGGGGGGGAGTGGAADEDDDAESGLLTPSLATLDLGTLSPLTPEVISRQATINVGTIGHVAHGKSTVVRAISGVKTVSSPW